jgi:hypothetical protein
VTVLLREAAQTCRALLGRSLLLMATVAFLASAACFLEGASATRFHEQYRQAVNSGSEVLVVKDPDLAKLSARLCQAIGQAHGVKAAGGIRFRDALHLTQAPGVAIQTASASPGFFQVIAPDAAPPETGQIAALAGASVAREVGLLVGDTLVTTEDEPLVVDQIADLSARAPQQNRWIIWTAADEQIDQCWIEAQVGAKEDVAALARSYYLPGNPRIQVSAVAAHDARSALDGWDQRLDRFAWAAGAGIALVMAMILWISRRSELALRRVLGFSRLDVASQLLMEMLLITLVALALVAPWLVLWAIQSDQPGLIAFYSARVLLQFFGVLMAATGCLAFLFAGGNLAKRLRDR